MDQVKRGKISFKTSEKRGKKLCRAGRIFFLEALGHGATKINGIL